MVGVSPFNGLERPGDKGVDILPYFQYYGWTVLTTLLITLLNVLRKTCHRPCIILELFTSDDINIKFPQFL